MGQQYKNIYFPDCPGESAKEKNLTLAFGEKDAALFGVVQSLSSHELRGLLGQVSYQNLRVRAEHERLGINTYCLRVLRAKVHTADKQQQFTLDDPPAFKPLIDPIQATFRGGQTEPLHDWYPYLEGYSPHFVEQVLQEFAPQATSVLDPFAGAGTTPLTVLQRRNEAFYCELNPLMQFLIETKMQALRLGDKERTEIKVALEDQADAFPRLVKRSKPDAELRFAYENTFGNSKFFDENVFEEVLQARTAIDEIACVEPRLARFLTVAVLASLIPASRLIRRGDVRFKTPDEESKLKANFLETVRGRLRRMADDLTRVTSVEKSPQLICEDARHLENVAPLEVDAVVTSPPYLNGTNYFRNTKVELWFLRCLRTAEDLSDFRFKAVTAGINDVTVEKTDVEIPDQCKAVVKKLEATAYDMRIPRMVAGYFSEMRIILSALRRHLSNHATVMMDIGDSAYGNVHVPTDNILAEILTTLGFKSRREVILRKRLSRGGFALRQTLLVFDWRSAKPRVVRELHGEPVWSAAWLKFKKELPHQSGDFRKRNWGHPLHSLCSYQGKMKPSLASHLVKTFLPNGGVMLDPFAGVGTIPFEAALNGIKSYGFEISPAALQIARAKLGTPSKKDISAALDSLESFIAENRPTESERQTAAAIKFNGKLPEYFEARTYREILLARRYFQEHPPRTPSESLVTASLLHILHGNRPYALSRRSHPLTPFAPTGPAEYRSLMIRLREKVARSLEVGKSDKFVEGSVYFQDATSWWPRDLEELDAVITSPPFFDSTRFYLANWMRLWFSGWEANDFKTQPLAFVDERQKRGFEIYEPIFRQARERLKPNGVVVLHLGKSKKCDMAKALVKIACKWFRVADLFTETVDHCESHGIRDKGTVTAHQFLVLQ